MLIRCLVLISGLRTAAPIRLDPHTYMPIPAPSTERPQQSAIPSDAQVDGCMCINMRSMKEYGLKVSSNERPNIAMNEVLAIVVNILVLVKLLLFVTVQYVSDVKLNLKC